MENIDNSIAGNNKVPFDPGWNDPPTFTYNAQQVTPHKPRLNKRVAFPLSNNSGTVPAVLCNTPPIPSTLPAIPIPVLPSVPKLVPENTDQDVEVDSERVLQEIKDILIHILNDSTELGPKLESIRKKINNMEEMWTGGKINSQVQLKMQELAKALQEDNPSKADEIHKALMVDHVSTVGTWMPGVKQLIYHCIAKTELLAIDKE